ncbi:MAG: hypothetical protein M1388_02990 [Thaumarchaeota archaeon]|jgi:molybdopterin converting factor small subunit|nr:hypothetical protein [Nitrososphaerota archaeon]MDG7041187.1 hypothetical protein [Nitrososphaerota archaeon]
MPPEKTVTIKGFSIFQMVLGNADHRIRADVDTLGQLLKVLKVRSGIGVDVDDGHFSFEGRPISLFINGREVFDPGEALNDGDYLMLFPVIDGG